MNTAVNIDAIAAHPRWLTPVVVNGKTGMATRTTANIVKALTISGTLSVRWLEELLYGQMPDVASERLRQHRRSNAMKSISRARRFMIESFGDGPWLIVFRDEHGEFMVKLR